jgi:hypothetical protein
MICLWVSSEPVFDLIEPATDPVEWQEHIRSKERRVAIGDSMLRTEAM